MLGIKVYPAYEWYSYKHYAILFKMFQNPYGFDRLNWVRWKFLQSRLYQAIMTWHYRNISNVS